MMTRYRLTAPIPAIRHPPAGAEIADRRVKLPTGAMLYESVEPSGTLTGMIGVYWEGRHYSVLLRDLVLNVERIATA
jgi:hypothetical protein